MLFNNEISNEELEAKVKAAHQKHLEHISAMRPVWELEGQKFRELREDLKISRKELSQHIGISDQVIAKFEKGQSSAVAICSNNPFRLLLNLSNSNEIILSAQ